MSAFKPRPGTVGPMLTKNLNGDVVAPIDCLEPEVKGRFDDEADRISCSAAISLKRIADYLAVIAAFMPDVAARNDASSPNSEGR